MRRVAAASLATAALFALAGCSQASQAGSAPALAQSDREINEIRFECLKDKGWAVRLEDGAIVADLPEAQRPQYRADADECLRAAGVDPDAPISDAQFEQIYASYIDIQQCLEDEGWSTPSRPSLDAFKATYNSAPWIPWSEVPGPDMPDAGKKCPSMMGGSG
ncbi:hypothetical protein [Leifsonia sp. NPDC058248]|uniref:hypothetical protein n=1 Tax=Leifsonia sp. NPDC058248 TaxID=3346402 RepID=UPI0036D92CDD